MTRVFFSLIAHPIASTCAFTYSRIVEMGGVPLPEKVRSSAYLVYVHSATEARSESNVSTGAKHTLDKTGLLGAPCGRESFRVVSAEQVRAPSAEYPNDRKAFSTVCRRIDEKKSTRSSFITQSAPRWAAAAVTIDRLRTNPCTCPLGDHARSK